MSIDIVDIDRALGGDLWVVQEETEQLQRIFTKMVVVGSLVNDSEDDVWVNKGPAKMSADFIRLYL